MSLQKLGKLYAGFAQFMSALLMGSGAVGMFGFLSIIVLMIYATAYVVPLIGVAFIIMGIGTLKVLPVIMGVLFITFGSGMYSEFFIGDVATLPTISNVPSHVSEMIEDLK